MHTRRLIISLLCAGALAFACGPRSHSTATAALASAFPVRPPAVRDRARRRDSAKPAEPKLDSRVTIDVAQRDVRIALNLRNIGGKHIELTFPNGQAYDFAVFDSTGRELWRWSTGRMFTQGVQNKQLSVGEAMRIAETWKAPPGSGRYTAVATLKSSNYPIEQRVEFVMH